MNSTHIKTRENNKLIYRPEIDGLRAVSILLVIVFHAFPKRLTGGFVGVDVFFVISGYLISRIILDGIANNRFSIIEFYYRRILRIFPALIVVILVVNLLGLLILLPDELANLGKHTIAASMFFSNFLLYSEVDYFDASSYVKPLRHLWSLGIEEQFYILWPMILVGLSKFRKNGYLFIYLLLIVSFGLNIWLVNGNKYSADFLMPFSRFWELMIGAILALYEIHSIKTATDDQPNFNSRFPKHFKAILYNGLCLLGIALIILSAYNLNEKSAFPGWFALAPTIGAAFIIYSGVQGIAFIGLRGKMLVMIGKISYPLYLWHWSLISLLFIVSDGSPRRLTRVIVIGVSFILAWLTYQFIEKKIRHYNRTLFRKVSIYLVIIMLTIGMGGYILYNQKGLIGRYPKTVQSLISYNYNYKEEFRNDKCLLWGEETTFASECVELENIQKGYPLVMIWGDSHGAMLYRALLTLHAQFNFAMAQFTSSSCPPIVNFSKNNRPNCRELNNLVMSTITKFRPRIVFLAHDWPQSLDQNALSGLAATVDFLRGNGVKQIILMGPVPHWNGNLSSLIVRRSIFYRQKVVPDRLNNGFDNSIKNLDEKMNRIANELKISYVSSFNTFCNEKGCLVFIKGADGNVLTTFDSSHLTFESSMFLLKSSIAPIIAPTLNSRGLKN